jgi:hypothetical protein
MADPDWDVRLGKSIQTLYDLEDPYVDFDCDYCARGVVDGSGYISDPELSAMSDLGPDVYRVKHLNTLIASFSVEDAHRLLQQFLHDDNLDAFQIMETTSFRPAPLRRLVFPSREALEAVRREAQSANLFVRAVIRSDSHPSLTDAELKTRLKQQLTSLS